jgi:hypothetical protein
MAFFFALVMLVIGLIWTCLKGSPLREALDQHMGVMVIVVGATLIVLKPMWLPASDLTARLFGL